MACSSGISSHCVPWGLRYRMLCTRCDPVTSWKVAAPLGHSRPREMGESGSPSMSVILPSFTYTFWPQPTAQYGQMDLITLSAALVRGTTDIGVEMFVVALILIILCGEAR